jgi:hypothetical protein
MCTDSIFEPSYKRSFTFIAIVSSVFALLCIFAGYIALPFAAAFYATMLTYEKKEKRIFSYVIPAAFFVLNIFVNGLYSLEGIAYVIVGLILYFTYKYGTSKGEAALYVTVAIFVMMLLSLLFIAFYAIESADFSLAIDFYIDIINEQKSAFVELLSSTKEMVNGIPIDAISESEAEALYRAFTLLFFPVFVICAFLLAGLTFKTFTLNLRRYSESKTKINSWHFGTNSSLAYFYLAVFIVNIFTSGSEEIYAIVIMFISLVLSVVYAYLGFKFIHWVLSHKFNPVFATVILVGVILFFNSPVMDLLSFVGVYYTVASNKMSKNDNSQEN